MEVQEGARPVRRVPVAALVDEVIGLSAYMNGAALNRLMEEGRTVSGAFLAVDPLAAPRLYHLLKHTPAVSGVAVRETMLASFRTLIAESLTISISVLVVFSCIIASGMVYNGVRINLSERGHELASLRVLGFTHREVSWVLLGEQALLTCAAIPFGWGLGYRAERLPCQAHVDRAVSPASGHQQRQLSLFLSGGGPGRPPVGTARLRTDPAPRPGGGTEDTGVSSYEETCQTGLYRCC